MKIIKVKLVLQQPELKRMMGEAVSLELAEGSSIIDAIKKVDEEIKIKLGVFPIKKYKSLLHMVFHTFEERFYNQVAVQAYTKPGTYLNVRANPKLALPNNTTIILVPQGPCIYEWEES
jgi:hypothetical protein